MPPTCVCVCSVYQLPVALFSLGCAVSCVCVELLMEGSSRLLAAMSFNLLETVLPSSHDTLSILQGVGSVCVLWRKTYGDVFVGDRFVELMGGGYTFILLTKLCRSPSLPLPPSPLPPLPLPPSPLPPLPLPPRSPCALLPPQ